MWFLDYCDENRILVAILSSYSTHTLQLLDVSMFKLLATAYTNELIFFMNVSQELTAIIKRDF